ncbi:MAG: glycosyltransferase family 2 protein [Candidatus Nealsonbacteria bacterium]|nr:glycosyltransferase family 2 protein [Candidatus Nealsonbacteria bacterium]
MPLAISLIIPAYNESQRLPPYLDCVRRHFDEHYAGDYEVIVVDDGSCDGTSDVVESLEADWPELSVMRHPVNRGKGAAVRTGMLAGGGDLLLFADADGATPIGQERKLADAIRAGADLAIGSRLATSTDVTRRRSFTRGLTGRLFAVAARWWLGISVRDTQCGFKLFRREAGRELFSKSEESGYLFDLELLVLAGRLNHRIVEVPIDWSDVPGSHLSPLKELPSILSTLWRMRVGRGLPRRSPTNP